MACVQDVNGPVRITNNKQQQEAVDAQCPHIFSMVRRLWGLSEAPRHLFKALDSIENPLKPSRGVQRS